MSLQQTQNILNVIENDLAILERKRGEIEQKEADRAGKINTIQRSITKNTSASSFSTKSNQIQRYQTELAKLAKDKAGITKNIAEKRKKRADTLRKLRNEETYERKKEAEIQQTILQGYEQRIEDLNNQWLASTATSATVAYTPDNAETYDVFVSHAWEDKEAFVNEFVDALIALNVNVWYDIDKIIWGDSMRAKIDEGLRKSRFGVVIISPNYIAEGKYWTKTELDGLFQMESVNGKMLLPIWHNITKKEVMAYSPIIAGKLAMTTASMTPKEIANELFRLLGSITNEK
jgi:hypothetical protein